MNFSKNPSSFYRQQGIGLVEVMVALLLLAIAVLGFTSMQMTAVKATDESLLRTRALTVMRGGAEMMRAYPASGIPAFVTALNGATSSVSIDNATITSSSCQGAASSAICTVSQLGTRDGLALKNYASQNNINIVAVTCPGTGTTNTAATSAASATSITGQTRQCLVASWGTTSAVMNTSVTNACADANGIYKPGAQCFIMEAY